MKCVKGPQTMHAEHRNNCIPKCEFEKANKAGDRRIKLGANFFKYIAKFGIHRIYTFRIYVTDKKQEVSGACLAYVVRERS
jgi:hypothetical protein